MLTDPKPQRRREEPWGLSENLHVGVQRSAENPAFSEQPKPLSGEYRPGCPHNREGITGCGECIDAMHAECAALKEWNKSAQRDYERLRDALNALGYTEWEDTVTLVCETLAEKARLREELEVSDGE